MKLYLKDYYITFFFSYEKIITLFKKKKKINSVHLELMLTHLGKICKLVITINCFFGIFCQNVC